MPEDENASTKVVDVELPIPPEGVSKVDPTIKFVLEQAFTRAHENWLGTMQHSADGQAALLETGRWTFQSVASGNMQLSGGILAQRSAQGQPQQPIYKPA